MWIGLMGEESDSRGRGRFTEVEGDQRRGRSSGVEESGWRWMRGECSSDGGSRGRSPLTSIVKDQLKAGIAACCKIYIVVIIIVIRVTICKFSRTITI